MKKFFWVLSFLFLSWGCQSLGEAQQRYATKVNYSLNQVLHFPDFEVEFLGMKKQKIEVNRHLVPFGPCYNFKISNKEESKIICWSSGTGDIAPTPFKMSNKCYTLERVYSEKIPKVSGKFANLEENELVINKAPLDWCRNAK